LQNRKERVKTVGISVDALHVALHVPTHVLFSLSLSVNMNVEITQCGPKVPGLNFFTAFLPMPSTGPRLNYVVETVSHKSANWR